MEIDPIREGAAHCRQLALASDEPEVASALWDLAQELEKEAAKRVSDPEQ